MKTDLKFYIKKVSNFLDKKTCEKTILEIKKLQWEMKNENPLRVNFV